MQLLLKVSVVMYVLLARSGSDGATGDVYSIGTGRYDITGPAVEINLVCNMQLQLLLLAAAAAIISSYSINFSIATI